MVLRLLPWALWLAVLVFSVATYPTLPSSIPQHFDLAGNVTNAGPKTLLSWLMLPGLAGLILASLAGVSAALPRRPDLFNFAEKERFLRVPAEYRGPVIARMRDTMDVLAALTMVVFAIIQGLIWRTALGEKPAGLEMGLILMSTVVIAPVALWLTSRVNAAVDEAERRARAGGTGLESADRSPATRR